MKIFKKILFILILIIFMSSIFAHNIYAVTQSQADAMTKSELETAIGELNTKKTHQGGSLSAEDQANLDIYNNAWNKKVTQNQIQEKDKSAAYSEGADAINNPDYFNPEYEDMGSNSKFIEKANVIIGALRIIGTVIAVVALMIIGIRYMFGSTADKAEYKETMIPWIIGAIMLFAIPNFLGVIYDLVKSINFY